MPIVRQDGTTVSERYLKRLSDRSFLSLWSYSSVFRDQGRKNGVGDGKEVCDLVVVFEDHVVLFSDKYCDYPTTGDQVCDWSRWFRKAVLNSANQLWGAERWIKAHPDLLFLDRACTQPFPIDLPAPERARFHRIAVAHGASKRCRETFGGSGSLIINSTISAAEHYDSTLDVIPFQVGNLDRKRGFVHVLDDTSLDIVLRTLDTVSDFVNYLTKKEAFLLGDHAVVAAGEEDLLGYYLSKLGPDGSHGFHFPNSPEEKQGVFIDEGFWQSFANSARRSAQIQADQVSYAWDRLIEKFVGHLLAGTSLGSPKPEPRTHEKLFRFMAREPRVRRRLLAKRLLEVLARVRPEMTNFRMTRVIAPQRSGDPYYVFLCLSRPKGKSYSEYREVRRGFLDLLCQATVLKFPDAVDVVGIAADSMHYSPQSEDAIYLNAREWPAEERPEAERACRELGLLQNTHAFHGHEDEFPHPTDRPRMRRKKKTAVHAATARNSACPCGSGVKHKRCCGRGYRR